MGLLDYSRANPWVGDALSTISQGLLAYGTGNQNAIAQLPMLLAQRQQDRRENQRQARQDERQNQMFQLKMEEADRVKNQTAAKMSAFNALLPNLPESVRPVAQAMGPDFVDVWGKELAQQQLKAPDAAPPTVKDFYEGGNVVQKQWNSQTKAWDQVGSGPRFAPNQSSAPEAPSAVREWQYFNSLSPKDQKSYLTMKRAADWQNLGGTMTLPDPLNPAGTPTAVLPKTLPPEDTPEVRGQQAEAAQTGKNTADAAAASDKKALDASTTLDVLSGVEDTIDKATGSYAGAARDFGASVFGEATEGAKAIAQLKVLQAKLMLTMPRMEGPQSDKDTALYREAAAQLGDPTIPGEIKKAAVQTIRELQKKYPNTNAQPAADPKSSLKSKYGLE